MAKNVAYFEDTSGSSNKFYLMVEILATQHSQQHGELLARLGPQKSIRCLNGTVCLTLVFDTGM